MLYNTNLCVPQNYVPPSKSLCAAEREFVLKRKQVALKSLKRLGLECTLVNLKKHVLSCLPPFVTADADNQRSVQGHVNIWW